MTFNPVAASNIIESLNFIDSKNKTSLDIGAQTISINGNFINFLIKKYKFLNDDQIHQLNILKKKDFNKQKFFTKDFFLALNFKSYDSIDINGAYESYKFDLNKDIFLEYNFNKKYNLVINNGTGEHVFNQQALFSNIHNLVEKNAIMLHILPFIDWINHGFYNFNPLIFADLAASNNYEIIKISFANRNADEILLEKKDYNILFEQIKPLKEDGRFKKVIDYAKEKLGLNVLVVAMLKKKDSDDFKIPLQGKYLADLSKTNLNNDYINQKIGSANAKNQISDNDKRNA